MKGLTVPDMSLLTKIFGDYSSKEVKRIKPIMQQVLDLEDDYASMTDEQLQAKTPEFKERLSKGETLDDILPEAFATCREAAWRVLGMKHFPVQIIGGIVLHQGRIAEMKTGEGKTLVATLPAYLNALNGKGVHIVTVNDYLARRDSEWMGKVYKFLGLTVGLIVNGDERDAKQKAYACDITYGTNNEMGFDYLRDNMVPYKELRTQRGHAFAIVDEVDSILIDEARTPLIISGRGDKSTDLYQRADTFVKTLKAQYIKELDSKQEVDDVVDESVDYVVDEKAKSSTLTKKGIQKAEEFFNLDNLMDAENLTLQHHINQALKAHGIMKRDVDYVVKDGEVLIVDEFTGRIMLGRRYNDGLHQAIEAKEGVHVRSESKTLATITFQNYFRLYDKLSGMTGTAMTESEEFQEIYSLDVISIPTNKPMIRDDKPDVLYKTEAAKFDAIVDLIKERHEAGQPILVGTKNIEKSELLSKILKKNGIKHNVLNAKFHDKEAEIIAQAGKLGAVTIATNMAGRGTDIILGGNAEYMALSDLRKKPEMTEELIAEANSFAETDDEEILNARQMFKELENKYKEQIKGEADKVREAGGLYIIGTERHDSRRIDNQLRGRSGRQGDPGTSQFFLSAEDELIRLFAGDKFFNVLDRFGEVGNMPLDAKLFSKTIEGAQKKVEGNNFAIRKNVLKYDDVMNQQREIIYKQRNEVLDGIDLEKTIIKMINESISDAVDFYCPKGNHHTDWNLTGLKSKYAWLLGDENLENEQDHDAIKEQMLSIAMGKLQGQHDKYGDDLCMALEHKALIENVDMRWMDHIDAMDQLENSIGLRAYAQQDPVVAFRMESYDMFDEMSMNIREGTVQFVLTAILRSERDVQREQKMQETGTNSTNGDGSEKKKPIRKEKTPGRNDPCPCGSGLKFKKCTCAQYHPQGN